MDMDKVLSFHEVAEVLNCPVSKIRKLVRKKEIPVIVKSERDRGVLARDLVEVMAKMRGADDESRIVRVVRRTPVAPAGEGAHARGFRRRRRRA